MWAFYLARARRILPALIALCAILLALGWFFLTPVDYKALGMPTVFSLAFLSNILFWRQAGYFDAASHEKWLLHTWSLSVEWQFYLLLPLALMALWKWRPGRKPLTILMAVGFAASLALSIVVTIWRPSAAFYLLPTRAWEMLAGGLVYLLAPTLSLTPRQRTRLEVIGFSLILATLLGFDAASQWPGWRALLPVTGAVLVLLAARSTSAWTSSFAAQWLGTRSYSIYLWHWPLVVALVYAELQSNLAAIAAGLVLTLVLGQLSYALVETPARIGLQRFRFKTGATILVALTVVVAVPGGLIRMKEGVSGRFSFAVEMASAEASNKKPRRERCFTTNGTVSASCMYGGDRLRAILIGDSHADAVTTALADAVPKDGGGIMDWSYVSCPTLLGVKNLSPKFGPDEQCGEFLEQTVQKLAKVPRHIPLVIVNRTTTYAIGHNESWENDANIPSVYFTRPHHIASPEFVQEFAERLTNTACQLAKDRLVYLMRPIPEMGVDVPKAMSRAAVFGAVRDISISLADYHQRHAFVWAAQDAARDRCGVKILDPLPYLCRDGRCFGAKDGRPLYYDDDHLSEFGNRLLVPMFAEVFTPTRLEISAKSVSSAIQAHVGSYKK